MPDVVETVIDTIAEFLHRAHAADGPPPLEIDDDGWLRGEDSAITAESPKRQALAPGLEHIEGIVTHWTDTRGCGAANLASRILSSDGRAASWHAVIDATGAIVQSVSAKHGSWHAGGAEAALFTRDSGGAWSPLAPAQRGKIRGYSANSWAFGIELECVGDVRLVDGKWCGWPFAFGTKYGAPAIVPADEVTPDPGHDSRGWHKFTDAQVTALRRVIGALVARYGLRREACEWGHFRIDPENRTDPGPLMMDVNGKSGILGTILDAIFC